MTAFSRWMLRVGLLSHLAGLAPILKIPASMLRWLLARVKLFGRTGQPILIFGLPKSGSTLLEYLVVNLSNGIQIMPWQASVHEWVHGESHNFKLRKKLLKKLCNKPIVIKVHSMPSAWMMQWAIQLGYKVIVISRQLDDVCKSYIHYVENTPFHTDHRLFQGLSSEQKIAKWKEIYELDYQNWTQNWEMYSKASSVHNVTYNQLTLRKSETLRDLSAFLDIPLDEDRLMGLVAMSSKSEMAKTFVQSNFFTRVS